MEPGPIVRRAAQADARAVADVYLRSRHASVPAIPPPVHSDDDVRQWFATVVLPEREVWVAADGTNVLALLVLEGEWVDQLYVDPAWFGRELGSALLAQAQVRRPDGLQLWAFESNRRAQRFYERHGFVLEEQTDGSGNEERAPDRRYRWRPVPSLR